MIFFIYWQFRSFANYAPELVNTYRTHTYNALVICLLGCDIGTHKAYMFYDLFEFVLTKCKSIYCDRRDVTLNDDMSYLNELNCFKAYKNYSCFELYLGFGLTKVDEINSGTAKQQNVVLVLHSYYHVCWCYSDFRSQGISRHSIGRNIQNIPSPASPGRHWLRWLQLPCPNYAARLKRWQRRFTYCGFSQHIVSI